MNVQHIEPINDRHEHELSALCPCHPSIEHVSDGVRIVGRLVLHNAWDKRELREGKAGQC